MTLPIAWHDNLMALSILPPSGSTTAVGPCLSNHQPKRKSNMLAFTTMLHHHHGSAPDSPTIHPPQYNNSNNHHHNNNNNHHHHHHRANNLRTSSTGFLAIRNRGSKLKLLHRAQSASTTTTVSDQHIHTIPIHKGK
jgi:hypothetical protein